MPLPLLSNEIRELNSMKPNVATLRTVSDEVRLLLLLQYDPNIKWNLPARKARAN